MNHISYIDEEITSIFILHINLNITMIDQVFQ